jgi:hypothetical protein
MTSLNFFRNPLRGLFGGKDRLTIPVKELRERDRRRMLKHFLALERHDRLLRFGTPVNDEQITRYVASIDFDRDLVFGVYNRVFKLVAVGHLAFAERDADRHKATRRTRWRSSASRSRSPRAGWASAPSCSSAPTSLAATTMSTPCTCTACRPTRR